MTRYLALLVLFASLFMHGCEATDVKRQDPPPASTLSSLPSEDEHAAYADDAVQVGFSEPSPESNFTEPSQESNTTKPALPPLIDSGTVSRQQYDTIKLTIDIIIKPIVCLVGLVLNVIGICVLLQPELRHGFYVYLAALSFADSGYLVCGLLRSAVKFYGYFDIVEATIIENTIVPYGDRLIEIACCKLGAYCIMLFSLDRFIAVFRPLKVKNFILSHHSKAICLSVGIIVLVFHIPKVTNFEPVTVFDKDLNMTFTRLRTITYDDGSVMDTLLAVYNMVYDLLFTYIPPVFVCVVNMCIIVQIQRTRNFRKRLLAVTSTCKDTEQQKLIVTVFVISAFFLMVYIPLITIRNLTANNPDFRPFKREHYLLMIFPPFVSLGWSINAAIDFTVYLGTSERFRLTLYKMCCGKRRDAGRRRSCLWCLKTNYNSPNHQPHQHQLHTEHAQ
ncbi:probable G-protein coupled receptor B0563.6 [Haliotis rubra]|uniref:probable G-protein coupled receptor B0563.6 n=1 Tax=Haliotis rubra TaxID=36100 RepID=UPI001EE536F5|nr:probable G-protein coupled receptor B0563.6 [Haliotis rubra]